MGIKMFELLKTVNKVGSSKAYPLITNIGINTLSEAIKFEQVSVLTKAPGIGKKMAEQIILSLKDKIDTFFGLTSESDAQISVSIEKASTPNDEERVINKELFQEALLALEEALVALDPASVAVVAKVRAKSRVESDRIIVLSLG